MEELSLSFLYIQLLLEALLLALVLLDKLRVDRSVHTRGRIGYARVHLSVTGGIGQGGRGIIDWGERPRWCTGGRAGFHILRGSERG